MNITVVIQARMASTRLPGKVLKELQGKSVIEHVIERVSRAKLINQVVVATSSNIENLPLIQKCAELGVRTYIGEEEDVLARFYNAARLYKSDIIVRVTSDCPVIDWEIIDKTIETFLKHKVDYCNNKKTADGLGSEVFTFSALEMAYNKASLSSEREHVTPFIKKNCKTCYYEYPIDISDYRWTLDENEDYLLLQEIFNSLYPSNNAFLSSDIVDLFKKNRKLLKINSHIGRDEGYMKSIKNDKPHE